MSGTNPRSQDFPQFREHIDKSDIRNTFRLPRLDGPIMLEKHKSSDWPPKFSSHEGCNPNCPVWGGFQKLPVNEAMFTEDELMSETSSNGSAGSNGRGRSKFTRGPRIPYIPILVESRDDSSGYSSDTPPEDTTSATLDKGRAGTSHRQSYTIPVKVESSAYNHTHPNFNYNTPDYKNQGGFQKPHAQRSMFDQQFGSAQDHREQHPKKCSSKPPRSPPAQEKGPTPGPFLTRVKLNAPAPLRMERNNAVRQIQSCMARLDSNAAHNQQSENQKPQAQHYMSDQEFGSAQDQHPKQHIESILEEMNSIKARVLDFRGITKDCNYNYLVEKLTQLLVKLDEMDSGDQDDVRLERKKAVQGVKSCLALLEQRINENQITAGKG